MTLRGIRFVSCGVLRKEVERAVSDLYGSSDILSLNSMLHMRPELLRKELDRVMDKSNQVDEKTVFIYGDCHAYMNEQTKKGGAVRTEGVNCCEILLGHEKYKELQRAGAFIFLPEWTERWREVFSVELGLTDSSCAARFMRDLRKQLIYLDTGVVPVPLERLDEISSFFDMPVEVMSITLDHLKAVIAESVEKIYSHGGS